MSHTDKVQSLLTTKDLSLFYSFLLPAARLVFMVDIEEIEEEGEEGGWRWEDDVKPAFFQLAQGQDMVSEDDDIPSSQSNPKADLFSSVVGSSSSFSTLQTKQQKQREEAIRQRQEQSRQASEAKSLGDGSKPTKKKKGGSKPSWLKL